MRNFSAIVISLALTLQAAPPSDTCIQGTWVTNGPVNAIVNAGNTVYIGGQFTQVGPYTGCVESIDSSTGIPVSTFPKIVGEVFAVCADGSGGWFVGGFFTFVNGVARNNIAHILSNNTLDLAWNPNANGTVYALAVSGTMVYVGGGFDTIGGQTRSHIAALDATTGNATAWNPYVTAYNGNQSGKVYAIAVSGTTIYAGGQFGLVGDNEHFYLAAIDATTGLVNNRWNPSVGGQSFGVINRLGTFSFPAVFSIAVSGTTVYVGGVFGSASNSSANDSIRNCIAAFDATTGNVTAWNPIAKIVGGSGEYVSSLAISGTTVYAGGFFNSIGGQTRNNIAALDATTGNATAWNPNASLNSSVSSPSVAVLAVSGTTIYACGSFTSIGGQTRNNIAALDATTGNATAWNPPNANNWVQALAVSGTSICAGGGFTSIGGQTRNNIAALDATTGNATAWNPNANDRVFALAVSGTTIYAGGQFGSIGGQTRNSIAALDATTGNATAWNPNANNQVSALTVIGTTIYAGGLFTSIGGQTRNYIAALDATTGNATAWNPNANTNGYVNALAMSGTTVYAGGDFTSIGIGIRNNIAALDTTTGNAMAWNPNANNTVAALAVSGTTVYAGGLFTTIGKSIGHPYFAQFGNFYPAPVVQSISPSSGVNNSAVQITNLAGSNFSSGAAVKLAKVGQPDLNATNVLVISSTLITCTIDITNAAPGAWDVVVTNPDTKSGTLAKAFTISLPPPVLISPVNNASNVGLAPILTWHKASNDSLYIVQVSVSSSFQNFVDNSFAADTLLGFPAAFFSNNTVYYWRVAAIKMGGQTTSFCTPWTFATVVAAPAAPVLTLPLNAAQNQPVSTTLSWSSVPTAASYRLQVSTNSAFTPTTYDTTGITTTTWAPTGLANSTLYYWRVAAVNAGGTTWSAPWSFTTIVAVPGVPNCLSPSAGAVNVAITAALVWSKITGVISYRTQIATDTGFTSLIKDSASESDTSLAWAGFANNTHYYWRVNSTNAGGASQWSLRSDFTTIVDLPSALTLVSPILNDTIRVDSIFLIWHADTPQVDRYEVAYASDSAFTTPTIDSTITDTIKLVLNLQDNSIVWWRVMAHNAAGWGSWSAKYAFAVRLIPTHVRLSAIPKTFSFNISSRTGLIRYALPNAENVSLRLYSSNGQMRSEPVNMQQGAGYYTVNMQRSISAAGSYLVVFKAGEYCQKKMIFLMR
jgi:hypothetical protein